MVSMLTIFFIEFASSRYLAQIDEKVMAMQLRESGSRETVIEPVTSFLTRRKVVINGKRVEISEALAGEVAERVVETLVNDPEEDDDDDDDDEATDSGIGRTVDEESPLLAAEANGRKRLSRRNSGCPDEHRGHHHLYPPPVDASTCPGMTDVTRKSQLLAVGIMEGGLCFHSIFVGLTLANVSTSGSFVSLFIAIMFHRRSPPPLFFNHSLFLRSV